jgi:hypothetical protein
MRAKSRRKIAMGGQAKEFSTTHPNSSAGYLAALKRLGDLLDRAKVLAATQQDGRLEVHAATVRKQELRRSVRRAQLAHLSQVARLAARELPELEHKIVFKPGSNTSVAFQTAARGIAAEAEAHKELLVKYGMVDAVLESLVAALDEYDAAVEQSTAGRRAHVGASAELEAVADEIVQIVHVMDGLNRYRFQGDPALLAEWESASNVVAAPKPPARPAPEGPPAGGDVRPAA